MAIKKTEIFSLNRSDNTWAIGDGAVAVQAASGLIEIEIFESGNWNRAELTRSEARGLAEEILSHLGST